MGWATAIKGAIGLALIIGIYLAGDRAGANRVIARDAKANARIVAAGERLFRSAQAIDAAAAEQDVGRQTEVREIYREVPKIIDRPVYRNVCVDADGVRLLERAVAAANGELVTGGRPAGDAGTVH